MTVIFHYSHQSKYIKCEPVDDTDREWDTVNTEHDAGCVNGCLPMIDVSGDGDTRSDSRGTKEGSCVSVFKLKFSSNLVSLWHCKTSRKNCFHSFNRDAWRCNVESHCKK